MTLFNSFTILTYRDKSVQLKVLHFARIIFREFTNYKISFLPKTLMILDVFEVCVMVSQ
jgi:hypothetical protein